MFCLKKAGSRYNVIIYVNCDKCGVLGEGDTGNRIIISLQATTPFFSVISKTQESFASASKKYRRIRHWSRMGLQQFKIEFRLLYFLGSSEFLHQNVALKAVVYGKTRNKMTEEISYRDRKKCRSYCYEERWDCGTGLRDLNYWKKPNNSKK